MSDSEDYDAFDPLDSRSYQEIQEEIARCKKSPETAGMFVSGWDDPDEDVEEVADPTANPVDHVLWAAEQGEVSTLKEILTSEPALVHVRDSDGYTPLHRAAYGNHLAAVSYLLSLGANISAKTELGWTPLHSACNWNNYLVAARLLAAGADPAARSEGEQTPLHLASAISHCKSSLLMLLLREDTSQLAKQKNNSGQTPEELAHGHGVYGPLFEMAVPSVSYIRNLSFTCNPYVRGNNVNKQCPVLLCEKRNT